MFAGHLQNWKYGKKIEVSILKIENIAKTYLCNIFKIKNILNVKSILLMKNKLYYVEYIYICYQNILYICY